MFVIAFSVRNPQQNRSRRNSRSRCRRRACHRVWQWMQEQVRLNNFLFISPDLGEMLHGTKRYEAVGVLGRSTDTFDASGKVPYFLCIYFIILDGLGGTTISCIPRFTRFNIGFDVWQRRADSPDIFCSQSQLSSSSDSLFADLRFACRTWLARAFMSSHGQGRCSSSLFTWSTSHLQRSQSV
jgi:hypothetical protein